MADSQTGHVVLMPIHPRFADAIERGAKKVEFRKTRFARDVRWIVLYSTSPVAKVVGHFGVGAVHEAAPDELWRRFRDVGGVTRDEFAGYFRTSAKGRAIEVREPTFYRVPLALGELLPDASPPQSYRYLPHETFRMLARREVAPAAQLSAATTI